MDSLSTGLSMAAVIGTASAASYAFITRKLSGLYDYLWVRYAFQGEAATAIYTLIDRREIRPLSSIQRLYLISFGRFNRRTKGGTDVRNTTALAVIGNIKRDLWWVWDGALVDIDRADQSTVHIRTFRFSRHWNRRLRRVREVSDELYKTGEDDRRMEGSVVYLSAGTDGRGEGKLDPYGYSNATTVRENSPPAGNPTAIDFPHTPAMYPLIYDRVRTRILDETTAEICSPVKRTTYHMTEDGKKVAESLKAWAEAREFYLDRGIPWRTGVQLEGDPGNGKTSYIVNLGRLLGCSVAVIDLGSCRTNEQFDRLVNNTSPVQGEVRILAYEDLDGVFDGRVNKTATDHETGVTFDHFLNTIDGAKSNNGVITVITTNHPERLDPALNRHGRIDYVVRVEAPTKEAKVAIASRILDFDQVLADKVVTESEACESRETGAAFEHRCLREAEAWLKEHNHKLAIGR